MASLISPGISISVVDQSVYVGSGPGTVPLIFVATAQDKSDPTGQYSVAPGTTQANAGKVWTITSQRDLISTFGNPTFYSVSGTELNGYPLNEYGLLAAHSYLGIANQALIVRADIDVGQLEPSTVEPTSPASVGTYWFDESSSSFGLFIRSGTSPNEYWTSVTPKYFYNFPTGTTNMPSSTQGVDGDYAVMFQTASGILSYWYHTGGAWAEIGTTSTTQVVISSVWPDLTSSSTTQTYWIKTTSAAKGANIVLRQMSATTNSFVQVEAPILGGDPAANTYYSNNTTGATGQIYISAVIDGSTATSVNALEFRISTGVTGPWSPLQTVIGSLSTPTNGPTSGQMWFNSLIGLNSAGASTIDLMVADGVGAWQNINLPGFALTVNAGYPTLYPQSQDPRNNVPAPALNNGDIWVQTSATPYPVINRWNGSAWILVDNTDQTTPNGIIFADARPNPLYHKGAYVGQNNEGGTNPDLDPDAPQAALYPKGFLLWNTRYSTNNVKQWSSSYTYNGVTAQPDDTNNNTTGRWVSISGTSPTGVPYMGSDAQQIVISKAMIAEIEANEAILAEDLFFNLIAAPGMIEAIPAMLTVNDSRADTAMVLGDSPMTLAANGTALQSWASNAANAASDGKDGLVSASKYLAVYYPSGLASNIDGSSVVVPSSMMALNTIAYNDQVAYPWFAPAGLQRGVVNNASSVGYVNSSTGEYVPVQLSQGLRDVLYSVNLNPIRTMPTGGVVIFGQKTRQSYASATDRVNVVRLENYLRYQFNLLAMPFLFEPNDNTTRSAVVQAFNRFLNELVTLRAVYDYLIVCDTSNNTPARIDANELWIDVAIQPEKAVEFIYIPIRIVNTGASLTSTPTA